MDERSGLGLGFYKFWSKGAGPVIRAWREVADKNKERLSRFRLHKKRDRRGTGRKRSMARRGLKPKKNPGGVRGGGLRCKPGRNGELQLKGSIITEDD